MALKHAQPHEVVGLRPLKDRLASTKTSAVARTSTFEAVRLVIPAGKTIAEHKVPGRITLHCIEGQVELGLAQGSIGMRAGDWLYLDNNEPHSVRGVEDASLLLTILFEV